MDRRTFLRNSSILAAGVLAADQLELVERLGWERKYFSGWSENVFILSDSIAAKVAAGEIAGTVAMTSWGPGSRQSPLAVTMELAEYRRRFGLKGHDLAFRADGSWLVESPASQRWCAKGGETCPAALKWQYIGSDFGSSSL